MVNRQRKSNLRALGVWLLILAVTIIAQGACSQAEEPKFEIHFYDYGSIDSKILERIDSGENDGWRPLMELDLNQSDLVINEQHLVSYNWNLQIIKMTSDLESQLLDRGLWPSFPYFVISYNGDPVVGGILAEAPAARYIAFPTLYISSATVTNHEYVEMNLAQDRFISDPKFPSENAAVVNEIYQHLESKGLIVE